VTSGEIGRLVRQIPTQYPFVLVDRILEHDAGGRLVAIKNVTGSEDFFAGHFPQQPVMPGVLILESLAQAAGIWLLTTAPDPRALEIRVVGFDDTKFRRPVVPGDQLRLEIQLERRRGELARFRGDVRVGEARAAEARLLLQVATLAAPAIDPLARVAPSARLEPGVRVGPFSIVGPGVSLGRGSVLDSHVVIEGRTRIGSSNLFMAQVHVAHDCRVGSHTILANAVALSGHVEVQDHATLGGLSGVHQFCRVGAYAFVGGATVATKDVLPFSLTVGNRARFFGLNVVGLRRRGFSQEQIAALKQACRLLQASELTLAQALRRIEAEAPMTDEVRMLVEFVRASTRGVVLERRRGAADDEGEG
jgi:UDP-N-acetylglucosamine acyltransferase